MPRWLIQETMVLLQAWTLSNPDTSHEPVKTNPKVPCVCSCDFLPTPEVHKGNELEYSLLTRYTKSTGSNISYISKYLKNCSLDKLTDSSRHFWVLQGCHCVNTVLSTSNLTIQFLDYLFLLLPNVSNNYMQGAIKV